MMRLLTFLRFYLYYRFWLKLASRTRLERWQQRKISRHLAWTADHSPFYRSSWAGAATSSLASLPLIDKAVMMEHFDELNTAGLKLREVLAATFVQEATRQFQTFPGGYSVGLSSGTSGNRGVFACDSAESIRYLAYLFARALPKPIWRKQRVALLLRANNPLYDGGGRLDWLFAFRFFDLMQQITAHLGPLQAFQPTILVGPPSALCLLADAQIAGLLQLKPLRIIAAAEVLDPMDARKIAAAFHQPVIHQFYQCTEGFLGMSCSEGVVHINEDLVHVDREYLDDTRFYPVITDFTRRVQPIIRYRLNDILVEKPTPCRCGSPHLALERIEGRADDLFYLRGIGIAATRQVFPDFVRRAVVMSSDAITAYRVVQKSEDLIEVGVELNDERHRETVQSAIIDGMIRMAQEHTCVLGQILFVPYSGLTAAGGKLRRIERAFTPAVS